MSVESVIADYRRRREHRLRERMEQIENPVDKFYLLKVIYKGEGSRHHPSAAKDGGPGSGYEDHPGRPGEVGGSLKSAAAANGEISEAYSKGDTTNLKSVIRSSLIGAALGTTVKMTFSSGESLSLKKTDDDRYEYEKNGKTYTANTMYLMQNLNMSSAENVPILTDPEVEERKELVKTSQANKKAAKKSGTSAGSTSLSADTPYTTENEKEAEEKVPKSNNVAELNKKLEKITQMPESKWVNQYKSAFESADIGTQIKIKNTIYTKAENDTWTTTGLSGKEYTEFNSSKIMANYADALAFGGAEISAVDPEKSVSETKGSDKSTPEEPAQAVSNNESVKPLEVEEVDIPVEAVEEVDIPAISTPNTVDDISDALSKIDISAEHPEDEVHDLIDELPAGTLLYADNGFGTITLQKQKDGSFINVEGGAYVGGEFLLSGDEMSANKAASVLADFGNISAKEGTCVSEFENADFVRDEDGNTYRRNRDGYFTDISTGETFAVYQIAAFSGLNPVSEEDIKKEDVERAIQEHWDNGGPGLRGHITLHDIEVPESGIDDDDHLREVQIARDTGLDADTCAEIRKAVWAFTGSAYSGIREAQQNGEESGHYAEQGKLLETFIDNAPTWAGNGEPLYRGVRISRDVLEEWLGKIETGETIDQLGTASWSTSYEVSAENFAEWDSGNTSAIILVNDSGETHGTSIEAYSQFYDKEEEVLVSKRSRQVLTGYEIEHGAYGKTRTIIHCYEVLEDL